MSSGNQSPLVIIDVGARGGVQERWRGLAYPVVVYGFEPDEKECGSLNDSSGAMSGGSSVELRYFPIGLARKSGPRKLYMYRDRRLSSFFLPNVDLLRSFPIDRLLSDDAFQVELETTVSCTTVDAFCDRNGVSEVDFIKLDTQGSELEILRGSSQALGRAFAIEVEVEFIQEYVGQDLFGEVDVFLRSHGFQLFDLSRQWWKRDVPSEVVSRGQVVFGDAVYMRDLLTLGRVDPYWQCLGQQDSKLIKTVIIASRLGYSDYALQLLNFYRNEGAISEESYRAWNGAFITRRPEASPARRSLKQRALQWLQWRLERRLVTPALQSRQDLLNSRYYDSDYASDCR